MSYKYHLYLTDTTECTLHVSSQPPMISLRCLNLTCQFEAQRPQGADCNIDPDSNTTSKSMIYRYAIDLDNTIFNTYIYIQIAT